MTFRPKIVFFSLIGAFSVGLFAWATWQTILAERLNLLTATATTASMLLLVVAIVQLPQGRERLAAWWQTDSLDKSARQWLLIGFLLGMIILAMAQFQLESLAFTDIMLTCAFFGYWLHYLMPQAWRLAFFVILSLFVFSVLWGSGVLWLLLIGVLIIGICRLQLRWTYRAAILALFGVALGLGRSGVAPFPSGFELIWPVLGGLFMFRPIIYLYQTRRNPAFAPGYTLAYFFLFPNAILPLFPVVDYNTFVKSHAPHLGDPDQIVEGLQWVWRGFIQLMLYRVVDLFFYVSPSAAAENGALIAFILTNYLLYLHLSGLFHIVTGTLRLFGFNLPPIARRYFLATNINDFWRRINIYWRDFMVNLFFYPAYSRFRGRVNWLRMVLALLVVLFFTWFLHAYQWFWIRGEWRFWIQDVVFWMVLGFFMIATSLIELRRPRRNALSAENTSVWRTLLRNTFYATVVFTAMAVLWSYWTTADTATWLAAWRTGLRDAAWLLPVAVLLVFVALGFGRSAAKWSDNFMQRRRVIVIGVTVAAILMLAMPAVQSVLGDDIGTIVTQLQTPPHYPTDFVISERGYYEALLLPLLP
jgi:D-alanyl-lipoteichoic acid acyltransferase DltB (MBOAT superfamily)